jgi:hypothetical protein
MVGGRWDHNALVRRKECVNRRLETCIHHTADLRKDIKNPVTIMIKDQTRDMEDRSRGQLR